MYPLLVSGLSSIASNLIDRWQSAADSAKTAASNNSQADFSQFLGRAQRLAAHKPTTELASDLLARPELSTGFSGGSGQGGPTKIGIASDGSLSILHGNGTSEPIATTSSTTEAADALRARLLKDGAFTTANGNGAIQFSAI